MQTMQFNTYQKLAEKARVGRRVALITAQMPQINIFWDGALSEFPRHTVIAQLSDVRVRMGPYRPALAPPVG